MVGHRIRAQLSKDTINMDASVESKDKKGEHHSLLGVLKRFADRTSMHGCGYIASSRHLWSRLMWMGLTLGAIVVLTLHLHSITTYFLDRHISTKVSLGFRNLRFPAITICNVNAIKSSTLLDSEAENLKGLVEYMNPAERSPRRDQESEEDNSETTTTPMRRKRRSIAATFSTANFSVFDEDYDEAEDFEEENDWDTDKDELAQLVTLFQELYMNIDRENRTEMGHSMEDMLLRCNFNGRECFADNFTLYTSATYGNCWTIDSSKLVSRAPGPMSGLSLVLYLQTHEYIAGITNGLGARVVIHQPTSKPLPEDEGMFVSAATETNIGMKQTTIKRLGSPYGECEEEQNKFHHKYGFAYTPGICHAVCIAEAVVKECDCGNNKAEDLLYKTRPRIKRCKKGKARKCMNIVLEDFKRKKRSCTCKTPCQETMYSTSISSRQWPSRVYALFLKDNVCDKKPSECNHMRLPLDIPNNFIQLNFYYETLNFEAIHETPATTVFTYLASCGGALGLWIGLSVLSICEILQLVGEVARNIFHHLRKRQV